MGKQAKRLQIETSIKNRRDIKELLFKYKGKYKLFDNDYKHIRVGDYDFWPATELLLNRKTNVRSKGLNKFLMILNGYAPNENLEYNELIIIRNSLNALINKSSDMEIIEGLSKLWSDSALLIAKIKQKQGLKLNV